jgi:hypothetical protein
MSAPPASKKIVINRGIPISQSTSELLVAAPNKNIPISSSAVCLVLWKLDKKEERSICPLCHYPLTEHLIGAYELPDPKYPYIRCPKCSAYLGPGGYNYNPSLVEGKIYELSKKGSSEVRALNSTPQRSFSVAVQREKPIFIVPEIDRHCQEFFYTKYQRIEGEGQISHWIKPKDIYEKYIVWVGEHKYDRMNKVFFYSELDRLIGKRVNSRYYGIKEKVL